VLSKVLLDGLAVAASVALVASAVWRFGREER